jgi:hypothetical protein
VNGGTGRQASPPVPDIAISNANFVSSLLSM